MNIEEIHFEKCSDFLNYFLPWNSKLNSFIFRGHANSSWELIPTALREKDNPMVTFLDLAGYQKPFNNITEYLQIQMEYHFIRNFYSTADRQGLRLPNSSFLRKNLTGILDPNVKLFLEGEDYWIPLELYDCAALAQHHGLPTRLLDWSYDPFISIFFALKGALENEGNLCIWCLNTNLLTEPYLEADECPIKFVTPPYYDNPNLNSQKGIFTHTPTKIQSTVANAIGTPVNRTPLDKFLAEKLKGYGRRDEVLRKVTLPCSEAKTAYYHLNNHGYSSSKIFPGFDGVVKELLDTVISEQQLQVPPHER
ncbi:FRG domain-containing protein [Pantoea sp. JGM49]|uniref:FRG domain-containing protein n=1 Tax=Pantoea sp. JGM49 TaxID=2799791 RepID=UPI001BAC9392|nr:FRG domain-containing protein [Pantoea sp. JGM49]MBS0878999.1 FRG domain-containing protein [Pantoea sp. JGM49]